MAALSRRCRTIWLTSRYCFRMEKIVETFRIKGRGIVAIFTLESTIRVGERLLRASDGAEWTISGIECMGRMPRVGELASVLFAGDVEPQVGDEIKRVVELP
jgi:hypothetical protein